MFACPEHKVIVATAVGQVDCSRPRPGGSFAAFSGGQFFLEEVAGIDFDANGAESRPGRCVSFWYL